MVRVFGAGHGVGYHPTRIAVEHFVVLDVAVDPRRRDRRIGGDAELDHEALDHAEEARVIVDLLLHQLIEARGAEGGPGLGHLDDEVALAGLNFTR